MADITGMQMDLEDALEQAEQWLEDPAHGVVQPDDPAYADVTGDQRARAGRRQDGGPPGGRRSDGLRVGGEDTAVPGRKPRCGSAAALTESTGVDSVILRRAVADDAAAVADVWLRSFAAALPTVVSPRSDQEVRDYIRDVVVPLRETWVAEASGEVVGMMVLAGDEISQLYLSPDRRGRGLGDRFMALAKERGPRGLALWTFQVNKPAHRFYERHGFVATERTDGCGNEEGEPDVRYVWRP